MVVMYMVAAYGGLGIAVGVPFVVWGAPNVRKGAAGFGPSQIAFRIVILPAAVALWPWVLIVWRRATGAPTVEVRP